MLEALGHDFSRAASRPQKVEGFSPCYVNTFPAFGHVKRLILPTHVLCHYANSGRKIALPDGSHGGTLY
jgi:hypothetical protein